jgi:Cd2+/Zn2+-exporting ATPase
VSVAYCTACELHAESTFKIEGMDCREEVAMIARRFKNLPGLEDFTADLMGQRLHVKYDAAKLSASSISAAVADAGMRAWLEHEEPIADGSERSRTRTALLLISGVALAIGLAAGAMGAPGRVQDLLFGIAVAAGVPLTARKAWNSIRLRNLDINVLMLVAAAGAMVLGQWSEAGAVVFLFAVAQALETHTLERARMAIRALMQLTPVDALIRDAAGERRVLVDSIVPGTIVIIKPGEKVPLDGEVIAGGSAVNQAPVTGESLPIDKSPGDTLFAGSINGRGALEMRATKLRRDTALARIIHLVEQAQAQRAPSQTFVERFAAVYTPAVLILAVALAVIPPLAFGAAWSGWIYRSLVLLVVSCPCALVISTPVSIVAALAGAARKGVLIKGGSHLERASTIRCVAFDKTGTLTLGAPEVMDVVALGDHSPEAVVALAAAVEQRSEHPIGEAIVRYAAQSGARVPAASRMVSLTGQGASGQVDGRLVVLGNHRLFEERGLCSPELHARLADIGARGQTPILVASDNRAVGIICVADRPRPTSADVIDLLRRQGITSLVMLTGDSQATAAAVAAELGIDEFRAELMPEDKVAAVNELRRRFGAVAMVGDGVNDAPALASADLGIAMGAAGSDAALETADIALMADDLSRIPYTLRLSRATMRNIKVNLGISLVLKAAFVIAAVAGVATLWMAIVADSGASVIVVVNALRLLRTD